MATSAREEFISPVHLDRTQNIDIKSEVEDLEQSLRNDESNIPENNNATEKPTADYENATEKSTAGYKNATEMSTAGSTEIPTVVDNDIADKPTAGDKDKIDDSTAGLNDVTVKLIDDYDTATEKSKEILSMSTDDKEPIIPYATGQHADDGVPVNQEGQVMSSAGVPMHLNMNVKQEVEMEEGGSEKQSAPAPPNDSPPDVPTPVILIQPVTIPQTSHVMSGLLAKGPQETRTVESALSESFHMKANNIHRQIKHIKNLVSKGLSNDKSTSSSSPHARIDVGQENNKSDLMSTFGLSNIVTVERKDGTRETVQEYLCNFCQSKSRDQQAFLNHILAHVFVCGVCMFQAFTRLEVVNHVIHTHPEMRERFSTLQIMQLNSLTPQAETASASVTMPLMVANSATPSPVGTPRMTPTPPPPPSRDLASSPTINPPTSLDNELSYLKQSPTQEIPMPTLTPQQTLVSHDSIQGAPPRLMPNTIATLQMLGQGDYNLGNYIDNTIYNAQEQGGGDKTIQDKIDTDDDKKNNMEIENISANSELEMKECALCKFTSKNNLLAHVHVVLHNTKQNPVLDQPYQIRCGYCIFKTKYAQNLSQHMALRHPDQARRVIYGIRDTNAIPPVIWMCPHCGYVKHGSTAWSKVVAHMNYSHGPQDTLKMVMSMGLNSPAEHMFSLTVQSAQHVESDDEDMTFIPKHNEILKTKEAHEIAYERQFTGEVTDSDRIQTPHGEARLVTPNEILAAGGGKTIADVLFLKETPEDLKIDLGKYYIRHSSERAECIICAYVAGGAAAISHMREHVMSKHTYGKIWGCPYCSMKKNKRNEIIKHVLLNHKGSPLRIVRRKPYELQHHRTHSTSIVVRPTPSQQEMREKQNRIVWQCPLCSRQDIRWKFVVRHMESAHLIKVTGTNGPIKRTKNEMDEEILEMEARLTAATAVVRLQRFENRIINVNWEGYFRETTDQTLGKEIRFGDNSDSSNLIESPGLIGPAKNHQCVYCSFLGKSTIEVRNHTMNEHKGKELVSQDLRGKYTNEDRLTYFCAVCDFSTSMRGAIHAHLTKNPNHAQLHDESKDITASSDGHVIGHVEFKTEPVDEIYEEMDTRGTSNRSTPESLPRVAAALPTQKAHSISSGEELLLSCRHCKGFQIIGVSEMKQHILDKHEGKFPLAIDVRAREMHKAARVHFCPITDCDFYTLEEMSFYVHIENGHPDYEAPAHLGLHVWRLKHPTATSPAGQERKSKKKSPIKVIQDAIKKAKTMQAFRIANLSESTSVADASSSPEASIAGIDGEDENSNDSSKVMYPTPTHSGKRKSKIHPKHSAKKKWYDKPYIGVDSVKVRYKCIYCEFDSNEVPEMRAHVFSSHSDREPEVKDMRKKACRQKSRLFFCPSLMCNLATYEHHQYQSHSCQGRAAEDFVPQTQSSPTPSIYQCELCKMLVPNLKAIKDHVMTHGMHAGYTELHTEFQEPPVGTEDHEDRSARKTLFPVLKQAVLENSLAFPEDPTFPTE